MNHYLFTFQVKTILKWAEADIKLLMFDDRQTVGELVIKCLGIEKSDSSSIMGETKLIVSEEKFRQREILDQLNKIEIQKIGGIIKENESFEVKSTTVKPLPSYSTEMLIDFSSKLVINQEREFSSGLYDIKIYERKNKESDMSYRFELCLAPPRSSDIFIVDFQ